VLLPKIYFEVVTLHVVAITGASGSILGIRLIEELLKANEYVAVIASEAALKVIHHEMSYESHEKVYKVSDVLKKRVFYYQKERLMEYSNDDLFAPMASGSTLFKSVIVVPCSMKTLAGIACGYTDTLIQRVIDVALKEARKCIIVPRETPLNLIHIQNLLKVKEAGVDILFPVPGFYAFPKTIEDVVDFIIGKILILLGIEQNLFISWDKNSF
jgi:flavin prenyltransferase